MWKCPDCGTINNNKFCLSCGRQCPLENRTTNKLNGGVIIACVATICVALVAVVICLTILFVNNSDNGTENVTDTTVEKKITPTTNVDLTPAHTPQPTHTSAPRPKKLYDDKKAFIEEVRKQLNVPNNVDIDYKIDEPYWWEAGGMELAYVVFTQNGEDVAAAACDVFTGEIVRSIYVYTPPKKNDVYTNYYNNRYGFSLDVPVFLENKVTSDNGDGAFFYDESREVELRAYGSHATGFLDHVTIDALYKYIKNSVEYEISYDRKKDNWFVLSGESNSKVFYEKHVLKSDGTHNCFRIVYPKYRQKEFDTIVTHIYNSFKTGVGYDSSSKT